jgi:hypothetical protein
MIKFIWNLLLSACVRVAVIFGLLVCVELFGALYTLLGVIIALLAANIAAMFCVSVAVARGLGAILGTLNARLPPKEGG